MIEAKAREPGVWKAAAIGLGSISALLASRAMWAWWVYLVSADPPTGGGGQTIWPLPGLYLVEVAVLALAVPLLLAMEGPQPDRKGTGAWAAIGALASMVLIGGFSIGPSLQLSLAIGALAAIVGSLRVRRSPLKCLLPLLGGLLAQAALMLLVLFTLLATGRASR